MEKRILIFIKSEYCRDSQIYIGESKKATDIQDSDDWQDSSGPILVYDGTAAKEIVSKDKVIQLLQDFYPNLTEDMLQIVECGTDKETNVIAIMHVIEKLLEEHDITIPDEFRTGEADESRLFGDTYYQIENQIKEIL